MSAAMVDAFDTHMQDYSSDVMQDWVPSDETMDDLAFHYDANSVEVEMDFDLEGDVRATQEYEMADGEHSSEYQPMEADVEDVQLFDAMTPVDTSLTTTESLHTDHDGMDEHPPTETAVEHATLEENVDTPQPETFAETTTEETPAVQPSEALTLAETTEVVPQPEDVAVPEPVEPYTEPSTEIAERDTHPVTEDESQVHHADHEQHATEATHSLEEPAHESTEEVPQDHQNPQLYDALDPQDHSYGEPHQNDATEETAEDSQEHTQSVEDTVAYTEAANESYGNMDAAPCILLSVYPSDSVQFYLFSQPPSDMPGPSSVTAEMKPPSLIVLLQEMQWLFSRGLGDLFAALREEEMLSEAVNLESNELVLNARDLRLTFSENHAGLDEVTLRDLNDLHEFNGFSGPLQLQIQAIPNFLNRFLHMKGKMNELHLGSPEKEIAITSTEPTNSDQGNKEEEEDGDSAPPAQDNHEINHQDAPETQVEENQELVTTEETTAEQPAEEDHDEPEQPQVSEETDAEPSLQDEYPEEEEDQEEQYNEERAILDHEDEAAEEAQDADEDQSTLAEEDEVVEHTRADLQEEETSESAEDEEQEPLKSFEDILNDDSAEEDDGLETFEPFSLGDEQPEEPLAEPEPASTIAVSTSPKTGSADLTTELQEPELDDGLEAFDATFELETAPLTGGTSTLEHRPSSKRSFDDVLDNTDDFQFLTDSPSSKRQRND